MKELLKLKRFWIAIAAVGAVVVNHFFGLSETQALEVLIAIVSAVLGTSAGLAAGKRQERVDADGSTDY